MRYFFTFFIDNFFFFLFYVLFIIYSAVTWIGPGTSLFQAQPLATWVEPQVSHCCIWDLMDHKAALLIGVKYSIMQRQDKKCRAQRNLSITKIYITCTEIKLLPKLDPILRFFSIVHLLHSMWFTCIQYEALRKCLEQRIKGKKKKKF